MRRTFDDEWITILSWMPDTDAKPIGIVCVGEDGGPIIIEKKDVYMWKSVCKQFKKYLGFRNFVYMFVNSHYKHHFH